MIRQGEEHFGEIIRALKPSRFMNATTSLSETPNSKQQTPETTKLQNQRCAVEMDARLSGRFDSR
jgi:hypothetical protein